LRCLYANYLPQKGSVMVRHQGGWVDMATARPHQVLEVRQQTMGYVSQFSAGDTPGRRRWISWPIPWPI
jgi:alpha-D-ribose 1-methylphosphonate 5-triphosphate synthase subunit PhnL